MKRKFHGAMKKNFSANHNSPICMKIIDIKLFGIELILYQITRFFLMVEFEGIPRCQHELGNRNLYLERL